MKDLNLGKEDDSVAEIIGAILLFAIAITLVTAYLAWYVPVSQTSNEITYSTGAYSSITDLGSMISSLDSNSPVVWSAHLGIAETFPIVPASDTSVLVSNSSTFKYSLSYGLNLSMENSTGSHQYMNFSKSLTFSGYVSMGATLQYIQGSDVLLADGMVLQIYRSLPPSVSGEVPFTVSGSSGSMNISAHLFGIEPPNAYASSTGPVSVSFDPHNLSILNLGINSLTSINGNITDLKAIRLSSLNYSITSPDISSIDLFLYRVYNDTILNSTHIESLAKWNVTGDPFEISRYGDSLSIIQTGTSINLYSLSLSSFQLKAQIS